MARPSLDTKSCSSSIYMYMVKFGDHLYKDTKVIALFFKITHQLVGEEEDSFQGEFPGAEVEEVLETWTQ